ncbi:MAG: hypothetical protein WCE51_09840 [Chthoniobacterales bacterium]
MKNQALISRNEQRFVIGSPSESECSSFQRNVRGSSTVKGVEDEASLSQNGQSFPIGRQLQILGPLTLNALDVTDRRDCLIRWHQDTSILLLAHGGARAFRRCREIGEGNEPADEQNAG